MKKLVVNCWLCGESIEIKKSRKGRPFLNCLSCRMQIFVNGPKGIDRLKTKIIEKDEGSL